MDIKLRYNTDKDKINSELPAWRVLIDGVEHLAEQVIIETASWTTQDLVEENKIKWHLSSKGIAHWDSNKKICTVKKS
ncbi:MAG: hypothetical protein ABL930_05565 [Pseudobdellovibrio sp.]